MGKKYLTTKLRKDDVGKVFRKEQWPIDHWVRLKYFGDNYLAFVDQDGKEKLESRNDLDLDWLEVKHAV